MKAHDVRHLALCPGCRVLLDSRSALKSGGEFWHGRCAYQALGAGIFKLPAAERGKFTLGDVGVKNLRKLMNMADADA